MLVSVHLVYFGGVSEFSSIFLAIGQLFQYYPPANLAPVFPALSAVFPPLELFSQGMFVLTFFAFRIVGWTRVSYMLLTDSSYVIRNGLVKNYRPGSGWFLWYLMTMSILLGALQVYWWSGIMNKLSEIMAS